MRKTRRTGWSLPGLLALGTISASGLFGVAAPASAQMPSPVYGAAGEFSASLPWDSRRQFYEQIPDRPIFDGEQSPFDRLLKQVLEESWIQVDYMLWNMDQSNHKIIGESVSGVNRPDFGYLALDRSSGQQPVTSTGQGSLGYAPRLDIIDLNSMNGMRLKYGLETTTGTFEASASWIFQTSRSASPQPYIRRTNLLSDINGNQISTSVNTAITPVLDQTGVTAIPFLRDGAISNSALIFNTSYGIYYDHSMFNTEFNYVWDDQRPINGPHLKYVLGVRYLKLDEAMLQRGVDSDTFLDTNGDEVINSRVATIDSDTINQLIGPQVGLRLEFVDDRFTAGVQPMLTVAANQIDARVSTDNLFMADNPLTTTVDESTAPTVDRISQDKLSPILSLDAYLKIRIFEQMQLYAAYNLMYLDSIVRPGDVIDYQDDGDGIPDLDALPTETTMLIQGLTIGTIIEF
ncbi:MAG: BBP7 family outer membrane beta-barrel protein [Planctomycetaceae bacterium]|nr:BBP7 family outer membrane beta-barrel protein [Planctomycetaceae bacterium]